MKFGYILYPTAFMVGIWNLHLATLPGEPIISVLNLIGGVGLVGYCSFKFGIYIEDKFVKRGQSE